MGKGGWDGDGWACLRANFILTCHEAVPDKVLALSMGQEHVCLVEEQNAAPFARQRKVLFELRFYLFRRGAEISYTWWLDAANTFVCIWASQPT